MVLRAAILFASENRLLRRWMEHSRHTRGITRRFVAGNTLEDAVEAVRGLEAQGLTASLDALGESVHHAEEARRATEEYLLSIRRIGAMGLPATVSLKLTQLGLDLSQELAATHLNQIVDAAQTAGVARVEVDMEASPYVDRTLELVHQAHARTGRVRAVIQAYLRRSEADIRELNARGIPVRLCKGAYKESASVAFPTKPEVDASFRRLADLLLREGTHPAIASHDDAMIESALSTIQETQRTPDRYEFQMLYGIRRERQRALVEAGHAVRIYVPYGEAWYPYLMRRMAERPANLLFVARNLVR